MDDLMSVDWNAPAASANAQKPRPQQQPQSTPSFPSLNPSPLPSLSRGSSPLSSQLSGAAPTSNVAFRGIKPSSKPSTPANDSFSSLLGSKSNKPTDNLSLQERQRQLQEEKERQRKQLESQFGAPDNAFWDSLGSGRSTPSAAASAPPPAQPPVFSTLSSTINKPFAAINAPAHRASPAPSQDEDDILAAFNSEAPVDASSHYPVPQPPASRGTTPSQVATLGSNGAGSRGQDSTTFGDDDDPFGLSQLPSRPAAKPVSASAPIDQDDDILGDLGKPVSELPPRQSEPQHYEEQHQNDRIDVTTSHGDPRDAAVAELVDMGFPADKSAEALAHTDSGTDIQAAVGWLLNQAHEEAKHKSRQRQEIRGRASPLGPENERHRSSSGRNNRNEHAGEGAPAWMREQGSRSTSQRRNEGRTPTEEKDMAQMAQEFGTNLFKSANSFWKQSQKKVQKAVAEFQQDGDPSQPKWMREAQSHATGDGPARRNRPPVEHDVTDEAMMLESGMGPPQKSSRATTAPRPDLQPSNPRSRGQSPASIRDSYRSTPPPSAHGRVGKLTREDVEEQSAQNYVSPARRKKTTPKPSEPVPEPDLFSPSSQNVPSSGRSPAPLHPNNPFAPKASPAPRTPSAPKPASSPLPPRPHVPPRQVPPASASALSTSASHRQKGTESFKRGDYAAAHTSYTSALQPLPSGHPIAIIVLCNRALTNIKVGDPKAAVADADSALSTIGPSRGEGEKIAMGGAEGEKDMKEFFGKALMRKAEALENMEKWSEAAKVWKEAVEAGVGGSVSIQGRNRCEKAAGGGAQQTSRPAAARPAPAAKKPAARPAPRPAVSTQGSAEAVKKLREANAAAEKADDEKFALTDQVDAKLVAWKGSKSDNLRALLGSLDTVLWPEAGWKKVGMQDLVMPNKVKIVYMKAIAKVHPDKISQDATTEQRMISAAVFATLNEAWDKFKKDNNL
ncbi:UBA domain-containing protein 7 [Lasiodiplodia hormozganensis]|uniref:UBA domain-containing protein 7 n=1 Tax=Lasiodiplodia hormozganensis TaxID=869390 RepID=A0AA39Z3C9_9PEZI|nr:UBA domain-containing protein 7 [Lasiodiplodia hormozganensis]